MKQRIYIFLGLVLAASIIPTWIPLLVALVLVYFYPNYYEAIALGILIDLIFARGNSPYLGIYSFGMLGFYLGIQFVKPYIRHNDF